LEQYALSGAKEDRQIQAMKELCERQDAPVGLQDGDHTEKSKDLYDELIRIGLSCGLGGRYDSYDGDCVGWWGAEAAYPNILGGNTCGSHLDAPTFLSRARVTAKELGLKPVEAPVEVWVPKVGDWVGSTRNYFHGISQVVKLRYVNDRSSLPCAELENGRCEYWDRIIPATEDEIAAHLAAEEAKRKEAERAEKVAKLGFGSRVMAHGFEWKVVSEQVDAQGDWLLIRPDEISGWFHDFAKVDQITPIAT
jgi:hypothetical protein